MFWWTYISPPLFVPDSDQKLTKNVNFTPQNRDFQDSGGNTTISGGITTKISIFAPGGGQISKFWSGNFSYRFLCAFRIFCEKDRSKGEKSAWKTRASGQPVHLCAKRYLENFSAKSDAINFRKVFFARSFLSQILHFYILPINGSSHVTRVFWLGLGVILDGLGVSHGVPKPENPSKM